MAAAPHLKLWGWHGAAGHGCHCHPPHHPTLPPPPCCSRFQQPIWRWEESSDAVRSYAVFFGILLAGMLPGVQVRS